MKISVIVPVYNVSAYIVNCLKSIVQQDYSESFECILVDDCGTDNSIELAKEFIAQYSGIVDFSIVTHEHNRGLSAARNTGINLATGDYILFLDSDDELNPNCLSMLSSPIKKESYDFVFANYQAVCDWTDMNIPLQIPEGPILGQNNIADCYHWGWFSTVWNMLISRRLVLQNSLFFVENLLHEDELWTFQLACVADSMYVVNDRTYKYYIRGVGGNIMQDLWSRRHVEAYCQVAQQMASFLRSRNIYHNDNLCKVIEWVKYRAVNLSMSSDSFIETYRIYKRLMSFECELPITSNLERKEKFLAFHNKLPLPLGFLYCYLTRKISNALVAWRHRNLYK